MRVDPVTFDELEDEELREMFARLPRNQWDEEENELPTHFQIEAHFPAVMKRMRHLIDAVRHEGNLPADLVKKLNVAVSMANDCRYCTGVFCTILSADVGSEEVVREFQEGVAEGELTGLEGDVVEFAVKLTRDPHAITDEDFEYLREEHGLTDRDFVQITYIVNTISSYNRVTTAFDADYEPIYHDGPWLD